MTHDHPGPCEFGIDWSKAPANFDPRKHDVSDYAGRIKLTEVVVSVCELCLTASPRCFRTMLDEEECHTPGCAFWMEAAPSGRTLSLLRAHLTP